MGGGQDSSFAQKRSATLPITTSTTSSSSSTAAANSGGGGLFRIARNSSRDRKIYRTVNNLKITLICGIITILVLRGTIGFGSFDSPYAELEAEYIKQETQRLVTEIRSDNDPDENPSEMPEQFLSLNSSFSLGPRINRWDRERKAWFKKNPSFPNYVNGKPRMMLVTGSQPGPCHNAIGDHYLLKAVKNKIDYCRIHEIEIVYNMAHLDKEMTSYWAKLPLIRRLMLSHPEVEWIWWMDSDAMFTDMAFEIPDSKYRRHNLVIHGYQDFLFQRKSWIALNTGSFLIRNCQWSLNLLDAWAPMGPKGPIREEAGKILTANLKGRPSFEADDQSALIYLLIANKNKWMNKVFIENSYYLHGYWSGLVDQYEEMMEKYHHGLGDDRLPFVTHFVGCKPCGSHSDYSVEKCLKGMERAFNFADNQVLRLWGRAHVSLGSPRIKRIRNETATPLQDVDQFGIRHEMKRKNSRGRS